MGTDMTKGSPSVLLLRFMIPLLLGNIFQQLYNMADTVIVGHYVGQNAVAAVSSTGTVMFLIMGICLGLTNGFAVLTSQRYGAKDYEGSRRSVANGIMLAFIIIVVMTALSLLFTDNLLTAMNTPADIYEDARTYLSIIFMGIICSVYYNLLSAFLRSSGNSVVPLCFLVFSAFLNVGLDLVFIMNCRMGVAGAALATDISQGVSAVLCWIYIVKKVPELSPKKNEWRLSKHISKNQLHIGLPMAIQFGITASGTIIMQSAINLFDSTAVAAVGAANKFHSLLTQGMLAIGQTMTAYSGQNYGVADYGRVRKGIRSALVIMFIYSVIAGALAIFLYEPVLPHFFKEDADIPGMMPFAKIYIWQCASMYFPLSAIFIFRNSIQGCNYALLPTCCGVVEFVARGICAFVSIKIHSFSLAVGCDPIAWVAAGIFGAVAWLWVRKDLEKVR